MSRRIFVDLTTEELAAVGAFLADDFRPIDQSRIVHQRRTTFAAGGIVLVSWKLKQPMWPMVPNALPL